jgi:hypothetical protein
MHRWHQYISGCLMHGQMHPFMLQGRLCVLFMASTAGALCSFPVCAPQKYVHNGQLAVLNGPLVLWFFCIVSQEVCGW